MKKLILSFITLLSMAGSAFAQIGSLSSDLVFTPITPCRIFDTRLIGPAPGTPLAGDATYAFFAGGVSSFASAGGSATNCGLQTAALNIAAVAVNFVAVGPAAAGYITVYPAGGVQPTASTLNYTAGEVVANSAIVKVSQTSYTAMNIYSLATTHLLADVTGYYSKPVSSGSLECANVGAEKTLAANFNNFSIVATSCQTGFIPVSAYCFNNTNSSSIISTGSGAYTTSAFCGWRNTSASAVNVYEGLTCCRIPGR